MKVVLYSTPNCPVCKQLSIKLNQANIKYEKIDDINIMISKGFQSAPMLEVDGEIMNAKEAFNFTNEHMKGNN